MIDSLNILDLLKSSTETQKGSSVGALVGIFCVIPFPSWLGRRSGRVAGSSSANPNNQRVHENASTHEEDLLIVETGRSRLSRKWILLEADDCFRRRTPGNVPNASNGYRVGMGRGAALGFLLSFFWCFRKVIVLCDFIIR